MDPNNQLIPANEHHQMIQLELLLLDHSFHSLPSNKKYYFYNQFLIKRANLFWNSGNYGNCLSDLNEASSNGQPTVFPGFEWIMVLFKNRADQVLESYPLLAKSLFDWCMRYAISLEMQVECLLFKGIATWLSGDKEDGVKLIEEVSQSYPDMIKEYVHIWNNLGQKALEDKDFTKAKNIFQRSLIVIQTETSQHKETKSHLLSNLATACFHLNEYQTALEKGKKAYALNPSFSLDEAEKWKERAEGLLIKGSYVLSIDYCTLAMKMTPDEAKYANLCCTLLSCRSVAYAKTNRLGEALQDAEECLFLTFTADISKVMYATLVAVRGNIVMESHPSLAEVFFRCSFLHAETAFDKARCLLFKAVAFWLSGNQEKAVTVIEEASKIYPDVVEETVVCWKKSGIKALEDKDFFKAKTLFQRSLIIIQKDTSQHKEAKSHLLSNLATACFHLNEYQTALEKGEEAYALNPIPSHEEAEKWKERIETIQGQENFELLLQYCTLAIKFAPKRDEHSEDLRFALLSSRCDIYFNMNQYDQALEDLEKCLARKPNWLKGLQQLGHIQLNHLGRHREAIQSYCKAFAIAGVHDKNSILQQILLISKNIPDGTVDVTIDVPGEVINDIIKQCLCDQDWRKLHLLFVGGGGPQEYRYGKGGLASGCDASGVPLELVVMWGFNNKVQHLPEFLNELLKNGALISGSQGCSESPMEIAEKRQDKEVLWVFEKYNKSQGTNWRNKGTEAYDAGDLENAVVAFRISLQCEMDYQDRMEVHLALSKTYFEIKDYQNSISTCNKAEEFSNAKNEVPSPIKSLLFEMVCQRGSAHYHLRNLQQALQDGIKATQLNSGHIKGYTLLLSCYKDLQQQSEMLSTLNKCLERECNLEEQWKLLKEAIDVALNFPAETTALTAKIPSKLLQRLVEKAVTSKDWNLVRLLYLGGGGPEKHPKGKGGIATGRVSAKKIAIEDVISAKFKAKQETISVLLNEGASVNGLNSNPLVAAVEKGQVEVAKTLLEHNADPCVSITHGNQPLLHQVVKKAMDTGNLTMLKGFLDSSHHFPDVKNSNGDGLYHLAMVGRSNLNKRNVISCLLNANVDPTIKNKKGSRATDCRKKTDERRKMIEKFLNERNNRPLPAQHVPQASAKQSTKQDPASSSPSETKAAVQTKKKIKKKDVRKELEVLIENLTINDHGSHFDEEVELEARELQEAAEGRPDEKVVASARESAGQDSVALIQKIDESVFNDFPLEVDFSDKFKKRFSGKKIEQDMKRRIVDKIIMLAQGRKNAPLCKRLEGLPKVKEIELYECKLTKGARILWENTKAYSPVEKAYTDTIRVWDVVMDHGDLDREIRNVVKSACIVKSMAQPVFQTRECGNSNTEQNTDDQNVSHLPCKTSGDKNEYDLKFYSFTFPVIEALLNGEGKAEINFPFKVTEREDDIITRKQDRQDPPIILLGRSGTGKTTCCLYRLCTEFQNYWEKAATDGPQCRSYFPSRTSCSSSEGTSESCQGASSSVSMMDGPKLEHFHPLFITKNDVLCSEVRRNFNGIIRTNPTMKSVVVSDDSPSNRIQDLEDTSWPLIVGSRDWLLLLDASLPGDPFFRRKPDGSLQEKVKGWGKESRHMRFLPLDDEDQKEREVQEVSHGHTEETKQQHRRKPTKSRNLKRELTYEVFRDELWPKMEAKLRKKIHPTLVWTEIRSFIKGSAEALKTPQGFLSRDDYQEIGRKRAPYFVGDRDVVYDLFELYQKCLTAKGMFDEADLVYHLHKRLSENPELPWSIHSVFVDETQDFTQAELSLLIRCCSYGYRNKMFFTGDTAQSIMKGIAFRFDDIKTLLYNLKSHDVTINVPKSLFQLTHNYRSHSGILKLASGVVKLLERFFPQSFDKLQEDKALFDGPKPVLLESCSLSDLAMILRGNERQTSRIEFGAHQAVLVVSEEARDNMPEELKHGLVLTIYEAKGLEFDDVLIYNFFKDSQAKEEWRIVTSYTLEEQQKQVQSAGLVEIHEKNLTPTSRPLTFNYEEHKVLNSEFKLLYTAITRARRKIWFFDEDAKARGPIFEYFKRLNRDHVNDKKKTDEDLQTASAFVESSTQAEWRDRGIFYLNQEKWSLAETCFTNAGDELMTHKSKALKMAKEAIAKQDNDMLCAAAVALLKCHMLNEAAGCLEEAGEILLLQKLYQKMGRQDRAVSQSSG